MSSDVDPDLFRDDPSGAHVEPFGGSERPPRGQRTHWQLQVAFVALAAVSCALIFAGLAAAAVWIATIAALVWLAGGRLK